MKQTDLDILLREGEGSMLEYKESLSSSFARDVVAFAKKNLGARQRYFGIGMALPVMDFAISST